MSGWSRSGPAARSPNPCIDKEGSNKMAFVPWVFAESYKIATGKDRVSNFRRNPSSFISCRHASSKVCHEGHADAVPAGARRTTVGAQMPLEAICKSIWPRRAGTFRYQCVMTSPRAIETRRIFGVIACSKLYSLRAKFIASQIGPGRMMSLEFEQ